MEMIVPDDIRAEMVRFGLDADILLDIWRFIDRDIPANYQLLRSNRPLDFTHEGFFVAHTLQVGGTRHIFSMWVDDASATGRLFLRDIQHDTV